MLMPKLGLSLALLPIFPAFVPGAMSVIGYFITLVGLIVCVRYSQNAPKCFLLASTLSIVNILIINDTLRLIENESSITLSEQFIAISIVFVILGYGIYKQKIGQTRTG
ncbi:hypothetical protein [Pseudoalteromonas phenolica]|uniref:hypothetical protein n=1 Tax=Pseudoalteromonas phenolica TaxID=161398 RepID=UPI00110A77D9|nr:hypothetical protein [Pseudoalteromonas phenolica]TMO55284.1 hypothetical protein CWC21_11390 [Pseudoalteromonas phenolica]